MLKILKFIIFNLSIKNINFLQKGFFAPRLIFFHRGLFFTRCLFFAHNCTSWSELKRRLIESFHQTDLTEIQVINKNIKGLNRRTIYRTLKQ